MVHKMCKHNRRETQCVECRGSEICIHNLRKSRCVECGGSQICKHGTIKSQCKECGGAHICIHNKRRSCCVECNGSQTCVHKKMKSHCKICGGSKLCNSSWCHTLSNPKYDGYCMPCFVNNPDNKDKPAMRNYKTKEKEVASKIHERFPECTWVTDKRIQDGCSLKRPDLLLDLGSHVIICEVDENKHANYDCSCENKRLMEISLDIQHRPLVFIRFNPDSYRDINGKYIPSCWKLTKLGVLSICNKTNWEFRIKCLLEQIQYWIHNIPQKTVEVIQLFY